MSILILTTEITGPAGDANCVSKAVWWLVNGHKFRNDLSFLINKTLLYIIKIRNLLYLVGK